MQARLVWFSGKWWGSIFFVKQNEAVCKKRNRNYLFTYWIHSAEKLCKTNPPDTSELSFMCWLIKKRISQTGQSLQLTSDSVDLMAWQCKIGLVGPKVNLRGGIFRTSRSRHLLVLELFLVATRARGTLGFAQALIFIMKKFQNFCLKNPNPGCDQNKFRK